MRQGQSETPEPQGSVSLGVEINTRVCVCVQNTHVYVKGSEACLARFMKRPFKALMMNNRWAEYVRGSPSGVYLNGGEMLSHSYQLPRGPEG